MILMGVSLRFHLQPNSFEFFSKKFMGELENSNIYEQGQLKDGISRSLYKQHNRRCSSN